MNITHAKIVTLPVSDQDRAKDFYVDPDGNGSVLSAPAPSRL
ncbi:MULTISPECIES: hypothetical protein [Streptosporangium]|uniref:Catechol 2,3-dioxygenase-like lactoylglutathione lyase family enzyme n=1 Tax=Streptosporangium brasiliense TaxID=47480 RepID=A0ABT9RET2_9ACTN|nr:hypothetical protein [Streptosporangium brasiliense]MDP9867767.1 catechol 2,3-dioxygenase-like lactoylglutathione lyase family enzyme [Streptosporangium brasiliense]